MIDPAEALAAANRPIRARGATQRRVLVLGGGGVLGSQVVEALLGKGEFAHVGVWTVLPMQPAMRRLETVDETGWMSFAPDTAVIVFDRERHANGRDEPFGLPRPDDLAALAGCLRGIGVSVLVVVVPHAPGLLPEALKTGLASLDEGAVSALDFRHLVFMRSAQAASGAGARTSWPTRLAGWLLGQLHWMVPQRDQPVRSRTVACVAARLAAVLPMASPGARVLPPEVLWTAAQGNVEDAVVDAWLAGRAVEVPVPRQRW
jgi:hypothetical protein